MAKKHYYQDQKVKAHSRSSPKSKKQINIESYDRKQKFRKYTRITEQEAKKLFDKRSQRSKTMDLKSTSKKVFDTPNTYWEEYMSKCDVKGIDTKPSEHPFYDDFMNYESKLAILQDIEHKIITCEHELNYYENYHKTAISDPYGNVLQDKYNKFKEDLIALEKQKYENRFIWQEEPSKWYYHEIDPRYASMKTDVANSVRNLRSQIKVLKDKCEDPYVLSSDKFNYASDIAKKEAEMSLLEGRLAKLKGNPKHIYWDDNLIEETIKRGKNLPYPVRKVMPEKFKQKSESMENRQDAVRKAIAGLSEKKVQNTQKRLEVSKKQFEQLRKLRDSKLGKDWDDRDENTNSSYLSQGVFSNDHISMVTPTRDLKKTIFYKDKVKKGNLEDITLDHLMLKDGEFYLTNPKTDNAYLKKYVDQALNNFKKSKIIYEKDTPLAIMGETYSMMIAPRMDDEDERGKAIPIKDYERLSKLTKKRMVDGMNSLVKEPHERIDTSIKSNLSGKKVYYVFNAYEIEQKYKKKIE